MPTNRRDHFKHLLFCKKYKNTQATNTFLFLFLKLALAELLQCPQLNKPQGVLEADIHVKWV